MPSLVHILVAALTEFNNAFKNQGTLSPYSNIARYLNPAGVRIYKVDDSTYIDGKPIDIVNDFNKTQATPDYWPKLDFSQSAPMQDTPDTVTGIGYYTDRLGASPIKVAYRYHFVIDPNNPNNAFIDLAFVVPIP